MQRRSTCLYQSTSYVRPTNHLADLQAAKGMPVLKTRLSLLDVLLLFVTWLQLYHVEDELLHGRLYLGQVP